MIARSANPRSIMLAFLVGFATIRADDIPDGVMPKRQVAGTGVTTPTSSSSPTTPVSTSSNTSPTSDDTGTTSTSNTSPTSNNDDTTSTSSQQQQQATSSTSIPTTVAVTTTNSDGSTITSSISTNTLAAVTSNTNKVATGTNSNGDSVVKVGSSTINPSTLSHKTTVRQPLVTKETRHSTFTSYWTSDGQRYSSVYTTAEVFASTTGFATATIAPGLADQGGSGSNLSNHAKSIIGGVVGGIGGAILVGGLAFVAWRLWGKKKNGPEDQNDAYYQNDSQTDSIQQQKRESMGTVLSGSVYSQGGTTTNGLERYQNPNGAVNTASNF